MAFRNAPKAWMSGYTVGTADIDALAVTGAKISAGTVTTAKLANPNSLVVLHGNQATPAAASHLIGFQAYGAMTIKEIGVSLKANGTASSTSIDVMRGATQATATTVFGAGTKLIIKAGSMVKVAAPSGAGLLAAVPDNGWVGLTVNTVASGTKSGLNAWVVLTAAHQT